VSPTVVLAGCPFRVGPPGTLDSRESRRLDRLASASPAPAWPGASAFELTLVDEPPWTEAAVEALPDGEPARVTAAGGRLRITHRQFLGEIDPARAKGRLYRSEADGGALEIALRVALTATLPGRGVLPLHAAGTVVDGAGLAFFGPSGAGKTTVARLWPGAVLSDELVAVGSEPPTLIPTGFFGEMAGGRGPSSPAPLAALVELARGTAFRLERLDASTALRRLIGSILVPPLAAPWREAVTAAHRLSMAVPVYRMEWTPETPPWDELRRALLNP
jgi:hypothetical protein